MTVNLWFYTTSISTHALLAEGDGEYGEYLTRTVYISTHALLAEGDPMDFLGKFCLVLLFQPTPSSRRATSVLEPCCKML